VVKNSKGIVAIPISFWDIKLDSQGLDYCEDMLMYLVLSKIKVTSLFCSRKESNI
jgi:hypothetical protein